MLGPAGGVRKVHNGVHHEGNHADAGHIMGSWALGSTGWASSGLPNLMFTIIHLQWVRF